MFPGYDTLILFLLILARISAFLIAAPFFSLGNFPSMVKVILALGLSAILVPVVPEQGIDLNGLVLFIFTVVKEIGVGLALGFVCTIIFSSLSVGGQIMDIQIGFFASQTVDPMTGNQVTILSRFLYLVGLVFFLSVNAHHELIKVLAASFKALPLDQAAISGDFALVFIEAFSDMMVLAVKIAAPVMSVALAVDVGLGLVGRTAPQMNIFILGFPIKIVAGIFTMSILLPVFGSIFSTIFELMEKNMIHILKGLT
ncbi:MAG: flagellar type III secretion system protein FliR [Clostridiales bacterium]|nr:flagellar type III secretion system protein FliR [Clostridiales bacterium]MCF8021708.1 flagellar type III secretion system protein FliR [Clostridiales bacterium]